MCKIDGYACDAVCILAGMNGGDMKLGYVGDIATTYSTHIRFGGNY